ncbi:hypothetical protein [Aestuariibaculum suncheonense]|uniref:Uncharacterized protein n=1 Tax=Aestuariibaculum suncheonense TaxID=1028745 RepID=A0A8J6UC75_9FLAO|nr:hypothetical protein [Aestuariibaculum suncheonense]MBD0836102.1 hypothetical protein [Aestuariibaculum suncheonense]
MRYYTCNYCYKEFEPTRRRVQKFCCNSCRSKAHNAKKSKQSKLPTKKIEENNVPPTVKPEQPKTKIEAVSIPGVINAGLGTLIADGIKSFATKDINLPATKGDLELLAKHLTKRYHKILNHPPRQDGALPYFDLHTNTIKYSFLPLDN